MYPKPPTVDIDHHGSVYVQFDRAWEFMPQAMERIQQQFAATFPPRATKADKRTLAAMDQVAYDLQKHAYERGEMRRKDIEKDEEEMEEQQQCDICLGSGKTLKGDLCICKDGSLLGLNRALRLRLLDMSREMERKSDQVRRHEELLREVWVWLVKADFDGQGQVLKQKIGHTLDIP